MRHIVDTAATASVRGAQLVAYTARVLRALGGAQEQGLRIADLVAASGLERATVNRIVRALCAEGLAMAQGAGARYVLGPLAFELGLAAARSFPLRDLAAPCLDRLAERTGDTCFLMIRSGNDAVCIDRREGAYPVKALTIGVGDRRPLGAAAGSLALLMQLPAEEREACVAANDGRISRYGMLSQGVVRKMLARAIELGFALNYNEIIPDVSAVGVAIPPRLGRPIAALSVSALSSRMMQGKRHLQVVEWLREEARSVADRL